MKSKLIIYFFCLSIVCLSCKKKGCTDAAALNYSSEAKKDDGTCLYGPFPEVNQVQRLSYGSDNRQHFDLYLPANYTTETKTVFLIHGGAWILGPKAQDSVVTFNGGIGWNIATPLLEAGYAIAVMKYRLACYTTQTVGFSGEPRFYMDQMLEDVDLAINKLKSEAPTIGISASDFALIGESAGAQIALMYAFQNSSDPDLKTVVSFFSPADLGDESFKTATASAPYNNLALSNSFGAPKYGNGCNFSTTGTVNLFWGVKSFAGFDLAMSSPNPEVTDTISPAYLPNIQRNLPTFILHGEDDDLVPSNHADTLITKITTKFGTTAAAVADFSADHKMLKYPLCGHGWGGASCNKTQMIDDVLNWLAVHFEP